MSILHECLLSFVRFGITRIRNHITTSGFLISDKRKDQTFLGMYNLVDIIHIIIKSSYSYLNIYVDYGMFHTSPGSSITIFLETVILPYIIYRG